jgi:Rieske Fe-S protein
VIETMSDDLERLSNVIDDLAADRSPSARRDLTSDEAQLTSTAAFIRSGTEERLVPRDAFVESLAARLSAQLPREKARPDETSRQVGLTRRRALKSAAAALAGIAIGGTGAAVAYERGKSDGSSTEERTTLQAEMVPADRGVWQHTGYKASLVAAQSAVRFRAGALEGFLVNPGKNRQLYAVSAACTHMGCMISWVDGTGTFLCPCHGAQYNADGTVLNGIARHPLPRLNIKIGDDGDIYVWSVGEHPAVTTVAPYQRG